MKNIFLTVLVITAACSTRADRPDNIIEQQKMVMLLSEIHLLEERINQLRVRPADSAQYVYEHFEQLLFNEFEISKEQYTSSINYYLDNPDQLEKIYAPLVDTLLKWEQTKVIVRPGDDD